MPQTQVAEDYGTPIFDTLAAEVGLEWAAAGWFDANTQQDVPADS